MAKFRVMEYNKPVPEWREHDFVAAGVSPNLEFSLAVGEARIILTSEEALRTMATWQGGHIPDPALVKV